MPPPPEYAAIPGEETPYLRVIQQEDALETDIVKRSQRPKPGPRFVHFTNAIVITILSPIAMVTSRYHQDSVLYGVVLAPVSSRNASYWTALRLSICRHGCRHC